MGLPAQARFSRGIERASLTRISATKWHFASIDDEDDKALNDTRGLACELVAWRFVAHLVHREAIDFLCYELPPVAARSSSSPRDRHPISETIADGSLEETGAEDAPLLESPDESHLQDSFYEDAAERSSSADGPNFAYIFAGLSALEIAAVSDAKKFLAQKAIQRIVEGIWKGEVVFWETLGTNSSKRAQVYRKNHADPFCRLRVPLYLKVFEVLFFATFLILYYHVLVQKSSTTVTGSEVLLYVWLFSFGYNELMEFWDAGVVSSSFYRAPRLGFSVHGRGV